MKRSFIIMLMLAVAVLAACAAGEVPPPAELATQPTLPDVVARVNQTDITREEYQAAVARLGGGVGQAMGDQVLQMLIEQHLIEQAAAEMSITVDATDVDNEINALKALTADWDAWLSENGYSEADFRAAIQSNLLTQRVRDAVLTQMGDISTIRAVHARHILVGTREEADTALARLNNGEVFEALAAELSRDITTRETGGNLGYFVRSDLTTPELADLAFTLAPGQIAGPVQTALGWHIVQTLEFTDRPVAEGSEAIALEQRFTDWLAQRRRDATVEIILHP